MATEIVLVEYDKACRQLARARYVDEVSKIREAAMMLKACAKIAQNKDLEADAWEIRVRAERRLGEMLRDSKSDRAGVGNPQWVPSGPIVVKPTLAENGIGKNLANRARRFSEMKEKEFGIMVNDGRVAVKSYVEDAPQLKAKPKKKPKPQREFECPHCGKSVYLKDGRLEK